MLTTIQDQADRAHRLSMLKFDACSTIRILELGKHVQGWQPKESMLGAIVTLKDGSGSALVAACDDADLQDCSGGFMVVATDGNIRFVAFEEVDFQEQDTGARFHLYELPTGEYCATDRVRKEDNHWPHRGCAASARKWILGQLVKGE